jgi:hypothetical protein
MSELHLERVTGDDAGPLARFEVRDSEGVLKGVINEDRDFDGREETPTYIARVQTDGHPWQSAFCSTPQQALAHLTEHLKNQ